MPLDYVRLFDPNAMRREIATMNRVIHVIDPQNAFCREYGSMARAFGVQELGRIKECLFALEALLSSHPRPEEFVLVRSEYQPGQFSAGDLASPYAFACVPWHGHDCDWSLSDAAVAGKRVVTKFEESAASSVAFMGMLEALINDGLRQVLITGFLTTSCVRKTALDLRASLPESVEIRVLDGFAASRASNYVPDLSGSGRHAEALREMEDAGIHFVGGWGDPGLANRRAG